MPEKLRFKGISLTKEQLEEKYNIQLTDTEWKTFCSHASNSWEEHADEFRLLVFKHLRFGLNQIGFKPTLDGKEITFEKKQDQ